MHSRLVSNYFFSFTKFASITTISATSEGFSIAKTFKFTILAMQMASKNLHETLSEVYEGEWPGHEQLYVQGQNSEMLWADLAHKLSDQVLIPLNTYQGQFPEMRVRTGITRTVE